MSPRHVIDPWIARITTLHLHTDKRLHARELLSPHWTSGWAGCDPLLVMQLAADKTHAHVIAVAILQSRLDIRRLLTMPSGLTIHL